jgi:hypothetical protein
MYRGIVAVAKQIAPPKATGGGGFVFEDKPASYFLACLLSGQPPRDPSLGLLSRVDFQTRVDGWFLDDLLLTLIFGGDIRRCALSVKSNQQFTANAAPREFVTLAWEQFLHEGTTHFRRDRDLLGLVVTSFPQELAFVTQSITTEVPHWEEIVVQTQSRQVRTPEYVKGRQRIKKIWSQQDPGLDLSLIQAAYSWQPALDQAVSAFERAEWISFWKEALACLLRRLGAETEDEEEIPGTPSEVEHWVLCRIAGLITQLRHAERPADFWAPILSLGTPGHSWGQTFLREWFVCGLRSEPASDAFMREWRAMLEYAFSSPKWSFDSAKRWFKLEEMWCVLIGFDWATYPLWRISQKSLVKRMYEFYEHWADRHLHRPRCARAFIAFLTRPAAEGIFLDGLVWLEKAARQSGDRFWNEHGLSEALGSLLDVWPRRGEGDPGGPFMQCKGIVQGNVVILEEGIYLPDGVHVTVTVEQAAPQEPAEVTDEELVQRRALGAWMKVFGQHLAERRVSLGDVVIEGREELEALA